MEPGLTERPARGMYLCRVSLSDAGAVLKSAGFPEKPVDISGAEVNLSGENAFHLPMNVIESIIPCASNAGAFAAVGISFQIGPGAGNGAARG